MKTQPDSDSLIAATKTKNKELRTKNSHLPITALSDSTL
jgi:hypothetical protein